MFYDDLVGVTLKGEAFTFTILNSFFFFPSEMFLHAANGKIKSHLFPIIVEIEKFPS